MNQDKTNTDLCRAVAIEVMGWKESDMGKGFTYMGGLKGNRKIWCKGLSLTGNDALRVIERMTDKGWRYGVRSTLSGHAATFSKPLTNHCYEAYADDAPRAVFEAALAAKRSQNNG